MAKPIFNAKITLLESAGLPDPAQFQVTFSIIDIEGVFSGYDVQRGDYIHLDTSTAEAATITRYKVLSVNNSTDPDLFTKVQATILFVDDNDAPIDPSVSIGVDGFISRPTYYKHLSVVPSIGTQLLPDRFTIYPQNYNTETLDKTAGEAKSVLHTITAEEMETKSFNLPDVPNHTALMIFRPIGGPTQTIGLDFNITGSTILWEGYALDGILEEGDVISISYFFL